MNRTVRIAVDGRRRADEVWRGLGGQPDWLRVGLAIVLGLILLVPMLLLVLVVAVLGLVVLGALWTWMRVRAFFHRIFRGSGRPGRSDGRENVRVIRREG